MEKTSLRIVRLKARNDENLTVEVNGNVVR